MQKPKAEDNCWWESCACKELHSSFMAHSAVADWELILFLDFVQKFRSEFFYVFVKLFKLSFIVTSRRPGLEPERHVLAALVRRILCLNAKQGDRWYRETRGEDQSGLGAEDTVEHQPCSMFDAVPWYLIGLFWSQCVFISFQWVEVGRAGYPRRPSQHRYIYRCVLCCHLWAPVTSWPQRCLQHLWV